MMKYIVLLIFFASCEFVPGWQAESAVEELIEEAVKETTGVDLDLSPSTPERNNSFHFYKEF